MNTLIMLLGFLAGSTSFADSGGCVSLQAGSFPFLIKAAVVHDSAILAGEIPKSSARSGKYGKVIMSNDRALYPASRVLSKQSANGIFSLAFFQNENVIQGWLQLSNDILGKIMNSSANPLCIMEVALDAKLKSETLDSTIIDHADLYLKLNNGSVIGPISI